MIKPGSTILHEHYGKGKVTAVEELFFRIDFGTKGVIEVSKRNADKIRLLPNQPNTTPEDPAMEQLEKTLIRVLNEYSDLSKPIPLGDRWEGGTLILKPANPNQKPKEVPIETFFHKIVMVRDRLRVLEQNINSNDKLSDEEKINLQQYITRIYGSLTTFNILFADDEDHFVGDKKGGD